MVTKAQLLDICERFVLDNPGCTSDEIFVHVLYGRVFNHNKTERLRWTPDRRKIAGLLRQSEKVRRVSGTGDGAVWRPVVAATREDVE